MGFLNNWSHPEIPIQFFLKKFNVFEFDLVKLLSFLK